MELSSQSSASGRSSWRSTSQSYGQGLTDTTRCARAPAVGESDDDVVRAQPAFMWWCQ